MCKDKNITESELIAINERNLERVIGWVAIVDSKAKFVLSVIIVVLGYTFAQIGLPLKTIVELINHKNYSLSVFLICFMICIFACLFASFFYLLWIIYPKRKPYTGETSYFFFETIAKMEISNFKTKMASISYPKIIDGLSEQTYNNSKVVKRKFDQLSKSVIWFLIGLFLLFTFLVIHQIIIKLCLTC